MTLAKTLRFFSFIETREQTIVSISVSQQPKLFLVLDSVDNDDEPNIVALTASQSVAGQYMDGDYLVLSKEMPLPVQAWMEAYIGRHGELLEQRRKKRKGAGRASGN